jgi:putative Ca2+/H+ antiporter (TMEM165/GDT1 family)
MLWGGVMETLAIIATSAGVVALAEMGDKTQLLAILLAVRFRAPFTVLAGIVLATLANHALAAWAGVALSAWLAAPWFAVAVALGFLAMAAWTLVPDTLDEGVITLPRGGAFVATFIAFFVVEIGDKTQIATIALAARYQSLWAVTAGTTLGMVLANAPAIWLGEALLRRVPMVLLRRLAAAVFAGLGLAGLWVALG